MYSDIPLGICCTLVGDAPSLGLPLSRQSNTPDGVAFPLPPVARSCTSAQEIIQRALRLSDGCCQPFMNNTQSYGVQKDNLFTGSLCIAGCRRRTPAPFADIFADGQQHR